MYFKIILIALVAYALLLITYPETRLWLKELIKKFPFLSGSLTCLVLVIITFLYFPPLFKSIAIEFWGIPTTVFQDGSVEVAELADLGPIGDIFGSLNSFISSIALCAVAFSTWLQVTSLKETRASNKEQLDLAKEAHDAQIRETQLSIFSTKFFSLLSFKNERLNQIKISIGEKNPELDGIKAIRRMGVIFINELDKNDEQLLNFKYKELLEHFTKLMGENFKEHVNPIISYYYIYSDINRLIIESSISDEEKKSFRSVLRNSMFQEEQIVLFWLAAIFATLHDGLAGSELFNQFHGQRYEKFALQFHDPSHFSTPQWKVFFIQADMNNPPA